MRGKILVSAIVLGVCLGVVVTRAVWEGRGALHDGDGAFEEGDNQEAIRWWRRAARWYVPLAPHVGDAYDRLESLARQAETRGDRATALAAWQGVRGSILATRSFYTPHEDRLEPANRRIAALLAAGDRPDAGGESWHYDLLARDEAPSVAWSLVALLGFATWIGGAVLFAWRGMTAEDRLVARTAATAAVLVALGLVIWLLGLHNA